MDPRHEASNIPESLGVSSTAAGEREQLPRTFGRLTLLRRLARGGMGEVYLAATRGIEGAERPCVVKVIRPEHLSDKSFRARFLDETRIQAQLQHPGVAQILEAATSEDGAPYAVVEYVEGRHLGEVLARSHQLGVPIGWADAVAIGVCFGDALAHVHERTDASGRPLEIAHRDLSPQNVMLGYAGDLKLIDFGTARGENRRCRTVAGIVFAKPGYVAPEVANQVPGGPQADLYAFGVMLWELIAGARFLQGETAEHQARVARGDLRLPPLAASMGCPPELDAILAQLTAHDLSVRFDSARRAVAALAGLLKHAPSLADGDRSVRGRIAHLMGRLYPAEPTRSRADFARRVALAREAGVSAPGSARPGVPEPSPQPPATEPLEGLLPGTRYRLSRRVGEGGMGEVWEAAHVDLGRTVAVKLLPEAASRSSEARQRFRSEARALARLDHPGIVDVHDFGIAATGRFYYVMELLKGETLAQRIERGPLPWRLAVRYAVEAASALSAAHEAGIVHRDITPANLFVTASGALKVIDFGVAQSTEPSDDATDGPRLVGTPEYVSPEQAAGGRADSRSDLYALGVVLYECVTGRVPHQLGEGGSPSLAALLTTKISRTPLAPSVAAPAQALPRGLDRVLGRLLEREPARRYQTAAELTSALDELLRTDERRAPRVSVALASGAIAFASLAALGLVLLRGNSERSASALEAARQADRDLGVLVASERSAEHAAVSELLSPTAGSAKDAARGPGLPGAAESAPSAPLGAAPSSDPVAREVEAVLELQRRGRLTPAHHEMKRLAAAHPDSPAVQRGLVLTAPSVKAWGEAIAAAERWVELEPGAASRIALARMQRATLDGDPIATLESVLRDFPAEEEARRLLEAYREKKLASR